MANIASNLYSAARQQASQGKTALERIRNKWNADIALMEQIGKITGNSMGASQAKARLAEFEKNLAYEVPAPTTDEEIQRIADVTFGGNTPSLLDDKYSGMRQNDVIKKVDEKINGLLDEYRNAQENLANATDFRKVSPEEQARILASPDIKALQDKVASFENELGNLQESAGITLDIPVLTRDEKGNYTSVTTGERNRTVGRLGEGVKSRQTADGSWEVYGVNSGTVFQSGLADASAAEAWANKAQSGGTADASDMFTSLKRDDIQVEQGNTPEGDVVPQDEQGTINQDVPAGVDPADVEWINGLYQRYFDRNASSAELANWAKETPAALESFMRDEASRYGYTSKYFQDASNQQMSDAMAIIDNSNLPDELKALWRTFVENYEGVEVDQAEILKTFEQIRSSTIDPYFKGLTDIAIADVKANFSYLEQARESEIEAERAVKGQEIRQAKEGLEASGMTFTGKGITNLGAESAYAQEAGEQVVTPTQEPFGGLFYEGLVNQRNRLLASSSKSRYEKSISDLGIAAESSLGSETLGGLGTGYGTVGGVAGDITTQKQQAEATTLNDILSNYYEKTNLNTNQTLT